MRFIADFHIHSHFSVATSSQLIPEYLDYWARLKGITVVGSGDFTHPGWIEELKEKLEPAEDGLFKLKNEYKQDKSRQTSFLPPHEVRFLLTAEISSIYKKNDKVRKVHNVIFAPDFETVGKIQQKLTGIGANITSDGRPILGMDAKDLLQLMLDCSGRIFFIPAHIWTPWFSVLGDKSGFASIEECFDDLADHIYAVETGLSSDPPMNWMCSFLDKYTLVSNSDAHSPEKLGRNANLFDTELSYDAITGALKNADPQRCLGTIDLFPQEGKYHYDGHRKCGVCWNPVETLKHNGLCRVCNKPVTVGVMNRVARISDRADLGKRNNRLPFYSIIPLKEILSELVGVSPNSHKVDHEYFSLLKKGYPELPILLDVPLEEIAVHGSEEIAEAIRRMRNREIFIKEGFDGEYGRISVYHEDEKHISQAQKTLFKEPGKENQPGSGAANRQLVNFDLHEYRELVKLQADQPQTNQKFFRGGVGDPGHKSPLRDIYRRTVARRGIPLLTDFQDISKKVGGDREQDRPVVGLNPEQQQAAVHFSGPALIIAGPGTGKTQVLAFRIAHLVRERGIEPGNILAVTFTNRAAWEMKERCLSLVGDAEPGSQLTVTTFHALGLAMLKELLIGESTPGPAGLREEIGRDEHFSLIDEDERKLLLEHIPGCDKRRMNKFSEAITRIKQGNEQPDEATDPEPAALYDRYETLLKEQNIFDLDDLIYRPVKIFNLYPGAAQYFRNKYRWIMVDEYQDINQAQYRMIRSLAAGEDANLCVIGDPDQAIYGFRGADVTFIRRFMDDFPRAVLYRLNKSYRCSESILKASREVMNKSEFPGQALSGLEEGVKIKISKSPTHKSEAEFAARTIEEMIGGLRFFSMDSSITQGHKTGEIESLADFAVLCRVKGQFEAVEKAFRDHSIPYRTIGELPFFKQEPVRTLIDMLRLAQNPGNHFLKEKLAHKTIQGFTGDERVEEMIAALLEQHFPAAKQANEIPVTQLLEMARDFGRDLDSFLKFTVLGTGMDTYRAGLENVTLMTLHAAKGLEFKCVFIIGCEDGLLPYSLFEGQTCDRDEERRLLYVGMTRAKKFLFLCHAEKRFIQGRDFRLPRSPFLDAIEKELIEMAQLKERKRKDPGEVQRSLFGDDKR